MRAVAALALVAALLVAFILLVDPHTPGRADGRADRLRLVRAFDRASVRRLAITRRGEASFSLQRQTSGGDPVWRIDPGGRAAAARAVEDLLTAIDFAETERTADLTPAAAGLAPPDVTLDLDTGGAALSLRLGRVDAGAGGVFVGVSSEAAVRVGPRHLRDLADRGVGAYLDPRPVPPSSAAIESGRGSDTRLTDSPPQAVTRIELVDGARRLVLDRAWGRPWYFEFPKLPYGTDARAIADWLAAAGQTRVSPPPSGTNTRRLTIEAGTREVVQVAPSSAAAYALLDPEPLRFRDRTVLDFAHFDVRRLRRTSGGSIAEIASDDGDVWRATRPAGGVVEGANVSRVVGALARLRCQTFANARPAGPPALTLEIVVATPGAASPDQHVLEIFAVQRSGCTGRLDGAAVFSLTPAACDELRLTLVARGG